MISIAVLLTCFNRKEQTLSCLRTLFKVQEDYIKDKKADEKVSLDVFLTDDGCTDGTANVIRKEFTIQNVNILQGDGNLFWAGGMRKAWESALSYNKTWDYFLLLNDDTDLLSNMFEELFRACDYSVKYFGKQGIVSGVTSSKSDHNRVTYGGNIWINKFTAKSKKIVPNGTPLLIDYTNANIMLIHHSVVDKIGIFYKGFQHGNADYDYSNHARKAGFPVLLTGNICGRCDNDHVSFDDYKASIIKMSLSERKRHFSHPLHSTRDYLCYIRRNAVIRYPMVALGRFLNLYFPSLYYKLYARR